MLYSSYEDVSLDDWPWPNFSPKELASKGDGKLLIDIPSLNKLQELRFIIGKPFHVLSAYRSPEHNKRVGGATRSQHLLGKAFDISMANLDRKEFEIEARKIGFTGFGFYPKSNFIHIDTGPAREWGERW